MAEPLSDIAQIRELVAGIPPIAKPAASPEGLEGARLSLARWLMRSQTTLQHPRIALFSGHHPGSTDQERAQADTYMHDCIEGRAPLFSLAEQCGADLKIYEMGEKDEAGWSDHSVVCAMAYGMMAVEPGNDLLVVNGFGAGSDKAALALMDACLEAGTDPMLNLRMRGGHETAAIAGVIVAARLARIPVILDGAAAFAALATLAAMNADIADHCATGWQPPAPIRAWFRERTAMQFFPALAAINQPGPEGVTHMMEALALKGVIAA